MYIKFNDGVKFPRLGFGTWMLDRAVCRDRVLHALQSGYRHIDTARDYGNEQEVGEGVRDFTKQNPEIKVFITTKYWVDPGTEDIAGYVTDRILESRQKLGVECIDLFLVHGPEFKTAQNLKRVWLEVINARNAGWIKSIGVSNFAPRHLDVIAKVIDPVTGTPVVPVVNQFECHPFYIRKSLREECERRGIVVTAWGSLTRAKYLEKQVSVTPITNTEDLQISILDAIAHKYNKTRAQILLRWGIDNNLMIIPKSASPNRISANFNIFDFELTHCDISLLNLLDQDKTVLEGELYFDPIKDYFLIDEDVKSESTT